MNMIKKVKISVVIPAYNASKYIKECLQSLSAQTCKDWEAVIVNDGSTDNTAEICESFAKNDNRFRIINKSNEGANYARRDGVLKSCGGYIASIDSDDVVAPWYLSVLYDYLINNGADIASCKYRQSLPFKEYPKQAEYKIYKGKNNIIQAFLADGLQGNFYSTLSKRELFSDIDWKFSNRHYDECAYLMIQLYSKAKTAVSIDVKPYYYRTVLNSLSKNIEYSCGSGKISNSFELVKKTKDDWTDYFRGINVDMPKQLAARNLSSFLAILSVAVDAKYSSDKIREFINYTIKEYKSNFGKEYWSQRSKFLLLVLRFGGEFSFRLYRKTVFLIKWVLVKINRI